MKKLFMLGIGATMLTPLVAFAQDAATNPPDDLGGLITALMEAAKGGHWSVFVAVAIMLLVYLVTKIKFVNDMLPAAAKPWVAAVAGVLAAVAATAFTTGNWMQAALSGLVTGAAAAGLWELIGKKLLKKEDKAA